MHGGERRRISTKSAETATGMDPIIHQHPWTFKEEKKNDGPPQSCIGCLEPVLGPHYTCACKNEWHSRFSFIIHKQCAELPPGILHPIHPNHLLTLTPTIVSPSHDDSKCGVCSRLYPEGFILSYYCSRCKFWIDIKCAFKWQNDGHEHSLTFKEEKKNDGPPEFCNGCLEPVLGPHYTCDTCNNKLLFDPYDLYDLNFILHKPCGELPREIHHPSHMIHHLILTTLFLPYHSGHKCGVCSQLFPNGVFLAYYCSGCDFRIDIKCASKWQNQNDGHEHNFTTLTSPIKFTCDVCGQGDDNLHYNSYICKICQLNVHRKCSWLPLQVKIAQHRHRLKLTWWFQDMYPKGQDFCDICSENIVGSRALYCCHDHECSGYATHSKCIRSVEIVKNILVDDKDDDDEPSTSRLRPANETTADEPLQIEHFSHQHKLTLIDGQEVARQGNQDEGITCNGCMLPIIRGESYRSCTEQEIDEPCNFSLHINCAKLPQKMLIPLHGHVLTLVRTPYVRDLFVCDMCQSLSDSFSYHCHDCLFDLDPCCSILYERKTLCHDAHVHTLRFSTKLVSCSSCGTRDKRYCFRCSMKCDFHLCIPCVKLPLTVRYKYDDHPLKLTYASVKNNLDEYYCDMCEGKRDPRHWFYSCPDCDFECHPHCIRGRYPQVKLGGSYKHGAHQHNVALVDKRKSEIPNDKRERLLPCSKCFWICEGLVYECLECGINFHRWH